MRLVVLAIDEFKMNGKLLSTRIIGEDESGEIIVEVRTESQVEKFKKVKVGSVIKL